LAILAVKRRLAGGGAGAGHRGEAGERFVTVKLVTSHATMDIFDSPSELSRIEEDEEVKQIISSIGR
jgi:hypothetical protein